MDPGRPLVACASCGTRALDEPGALVLPLKDLPANHWLRFTDEQRAELQGLPDVTLLSSIGDTRSVNLNLLRSFDTDCDDVFYNVHRSFLGLIALVAPHPLDSAPYAALLPRNNRRHLHRQAWRLVVIMVCFLAWA